MCLREVGGGGGGRWSTVTMYSGEHRVCMSKLIAPMFGLLTHYQILSVWFKRGSI